MQSARKSVKRVRLAAASPVKKILNAMGKVEETIASLLVLCSAEVNSHPRLRLLHVYWPQDLTSSPLCSGHVH